MDLFLLIAFKSRQTSHRGGKAYQNIMHTHASLLYVGILSSIEREGCNTHDPSSKIIFCVCFLRSTSILLVPKFRRNPLTVSVLLYYYYGTSAFTFLEKGKRIKAKDRKRTSTACPYACISMSVPSKHSIAQYTYLPTCLDNNWT